MKKATALLQGAKVLMPKMPATRNGGFIHSLTEVNSPVKLKIKDVTESRQPGGGEFTFNIKEADPKPAEAAPNAESSPIESTSIIRITDSAQNVKRNYSREPEALKQKSRAKARLWSLYQSLDEDDDYKHGEHPLEIGLELWRHFDALAPVDLCDVLVKAPAPLADAEQ